MNIFVTFSDTCAPGCTVSRRCSAKDKGLFATVKFFQLGQLSIPDDVESRFLRALTLQEDTEREQLLQDATIVRKTTEAEVIMIIIIIIIIIMIIINIIIIIMIMIIIIIIIIMMIIIMIIIIIIIMIMIIIGIYIAPFPFIKCSGKQQRQR